MTGKRMHQQEDNPEHRSKIQKTLNSNHPGGPRPDHDYSHMVTEPMSRKDSQNNIQREKEGRAENSTEKEKQSNGDGIHEQDPVWKKSERRQRANNNDSHSSLKLSSKWNILKKLEHSDTTTKIARRKTK